MVKYKRTYADDAEKLQRLILLRQQVLDIFEHNMRRQLGQETYGQAVNAFTDMVSCQRPLADLSSEAGTGNGLWLQNLVYFL